MESKTLIVYYTFTNNTKIIAQKIKEKMNCDVLELEIKKPYPNDYDYVVDLTRNNAKEKMTSELKEYDIDLKKYTTIIIGTPVWWYTMVPAIRTFLMENKLEGKTIIPYATNAGWLGSTFEDIKDLCKDSIVKNELDIVFSGDHRENKLVTSEQTINQWIENINK